MGRTKLSNLRNGSKGDSNPCLLDCESGVLTLSYRAPHLPVSVKRFERSNGLDTALYKNYLYFTLPIKMLPTFKSVLFLNNVKFGNNIIQVLRVN